MFVIFYTVAFILLTPCLAFLTLFLKTCFINEYGACYVVLKDLYTAKSSKYCKYMFNEITPETHKILPFYCCGTEGVV